MLLRWLLIAVIAVYSTSWIKLVMAADLHNTLPVASNGWRPIVGTQVKSYATIEHQNQKQTISLTSNDHQEHPNKLDKNKLPPNQKGNNGGNQVHINHHGSTGHHLLTLHKNKPLQAPSKPGSGGGKPAPRHPVLGKLHAHLAHGKRHKAGTPPSPPLPRDEIMAPAPSSAIGSYAYFNQGPINIQNTQLVHNKPYHNPGHVDFSNQFAFSNDVVLPQQQYNYQKHPSQNELHPNHYVFINQNDDFTRNLVPPPPIYKPQGEKETLLVKEPHKINEHNSQRDEISHLPENVIVQLSPSYKHYQQHGHPIFDLEITKENLKEYHTTLAPSSYKTSTESFLDATKYTKQRELFTNPSLHGYEVTEDKEWVEQLPPFKPIYSTSKPNEYYKNNNRFHFVQQQQHQQDLTRPSESVQLHYSQQDDLPPNPQFLPTPYNPTSAFPTSPTQAEVSTIYSEISQINKKKNAYQIPSTTVYNLKEVATHFPIYNYNKTPDTQLNIPSNQEDIPEVTTRKQEDETESTLPYSKPTQQTTFPTHGMTWEQRRPSHRRRRPRPTTTTEAVVTDDTYAYQSQSPETERPSIKPHRRRRPIKYRTTEAPRDSTTVTEATTRFYRTRPTRPQPQTITEEVFVSKNHRHRPTYQYNQENEHRNKFVTTKTDENLFTNTEENVNNDNIEYTQNPATEIIRFNNNNNHQYQEEEEADVVTETEQPIRIINKRLRPILTTTTEVLQNTNLNIPENELDYTTISSNDEQSDESITDIYDFEKEKQDTTMLITTLSAPSSTPSATTTSTTEPTTTKTNRIRQRPIKYVVDRPTFSVKNYRQRLNQYMSTSTTESTKSNSEPVAPIRIRYPSRLKLSTPSTETDESTEPSRQKYIPKDSRRRYTTNTDAADTSSTEKYLRTMNPRLKPYGRYRSTTESTPTSSTTQKIAIKSNIFNNLKRPQQLSLRNRIYNKRNSTTTTTTTELYTEEPNKNDSLLNTEKTEVTIPFEIAESKIEVTTQLYEPIEDVEILTTTVKTKSNEHQQVSSPDEAEAFLQLQRISDLTSSAHKQYNTPGMFKSVSPTSRRVPSYFTIATEDPILPIEAFFQF